MADMICLYPVPHRQAKAGSESQVTVCGSHTNRRDHSLVLGVTEGNVVASFADSRV